LAQRKAERAAEYGRLSERDKRLVDQGELAEGMDQNAVYIAWGKPTHVVDRPTPEGLQTTWTYNRRHTHLTPNWSARPTQHGLWTYDYTPTPSSGEYVSAQAMFLNGSLVSWNRFPPPGQY
jgi:hypothetical protein